MLLKEMTIREIANRLDARCIPNVIAELNLQESLQPIVEAIGPERLQGCLDDGPCWAIATAIWALAQNQVVPHSLVLNNSGWIAPAILGEMTIDELQEVALRQIKEQQINSLPSSRDALIERIRFAQHAWAVGETCPNCGAKEFFEVLGDTKTCQRCGCEWQDLKEVYGFEVVTEGR